MPRLPIYPAHADFVAPAMGTAAIWRVLLGILMVVAGYIALFRLGVEAAFGVFPALDGDSFDRFFDGLTPGAMLLLLMTFGCITLPLAVVTRLLHRRSWLTLLGALPLALRQFVRVLGALVVLGVVLFLLPPWDMGGALQPNLAFGLWTLLLPLSLVAVMVQISAEELFFRGYLQQQLGARFAARWVWMGLPSVLFALGHYMPQEAGSNAVAVAIWAGIFGLLMADITARAGTLGPALALHFANNVNAILLVSLQGDLSGLALYLAPFGMEDEALLRAWLPVDFVYMIVTWLVARLVLRR